jgi:hypothetical protein
MQRIKKISMEILAVNALLSPEKSNDLLKKSGKT